MVGETESVDHWIVGREILIDKREDRGGKADCAEGEQDDFAPAGHGELDSRRVGDVQCEVALIN